MQFAVPQFTEVEDRLIARLTLRQFFVMLGAGVIILFFWSVLGPSLIFFLIAVPIGLAGAGAALGTYNGRPVFTYIVPFAAYLTSTRVRVFKREDAIVSVSKAETAPPRVVKEMAAEEQDESTDSRLKKLAYLLDRKSHEEGEIASNVFEKISAPPPTPTPVSKKISTVNTLNKPIPPPVGRHGYKPAPVPPKAEPPIRKFDPNSII